MGTLAGHGGKWWGFPGIGYLTRGENRPRLLRLEHCTDILVEKFALLQSPYWTFYANSVEGLEVRHSVIDARRLDDDGHTIIDETAFNTVRSLPLFQRLDALQRHCKIATLARIPMWPSV